jgi:hypothetical protein
MITGCPIGHTGINKYMEGTLVRLYTDNVNEVEVLLHALKLLRVNTSSNYERGVCDKLTARIERCQELQHPNRKDKK